MRAGRKKAVPLLRRADPEYQSWTIHDRPQDRETYQDGDRSLSNLWRDRPYLDVEQPHMDADPDIDAEEAGEPAKRLNTESVVRRAVMELTAAEPEDLERERAKHLDTSGAFSGPLWEKVAPLVNTVLDIMRQNQDGDQLASKLESSSIRKKELILAVAKKAEMFGFGYRTAKKDWDRFMELVPALTGMFKDDHNRELLKNALGEWAKEEGDIKPRGFAGAPAQKDWGFEIFAPKGSGGADTQEFYEGYVPGAVPRQETYNVERLVTLARGDWEGMTNKLRARLEERMIVDFDTARVNTQRLQSMLRYVTDQPDSQLAMAIVVGTVVREAIRQAGAAGEEAVQFDDGGRVRLNISSGQLLSGMQGGTKRIIDEWLNIAVSIMRVVGVLPDDEAEEGAEDAEYLKADMSKYQVLQSRMRDGLAKIGLKIAREAIQGLHNRSPDIQDEGGPDIRALRRAIVAPVTELAREGKLGDAEAEAERVLEALDDALGDGDAAAAAQAAQELHGIVSGLGASPASLSSATAAVDELRAMAAPRAASVTVADIAKRIVAPAKVRVVPQAEAEDGIELGGGEALELPSKYHSARRVIGGQPWASR